MNMVGKLGSVITRGVYSVATPFHPFGGAVDIIVVEQQDGTYRSTPWYVRFGKFQGVLKGAEKIVHISVNGVESNFHMYLDNSGEAYFLREVVPGSEDVESNDQDSSRLSSLRTCDSDNIESIEDGHQDVCDESKVVVDDRRQTHGSQDEQSPIASLSASPGRSTYHYENSDELENLVKSSEDSNSEMVLMSIDGYVITAPISMEEKNSDNVQSSIPQFHLGPGEASIEELDGSGDVWTAGLFCDLDSSAETGTKSSEHQNEGTEYVKRVPVCESEANDIRDVDIESSSEGTSAGINKDYDTFKSCLDLTAHFEGEDSEDACSLALELEMKEESEQTFSSIDVTLEGEAVTVDNNLRNCASLPLPSSDIPCSADMQVLDMEMKNSGNSISDTPGLKDVQPVGHACPSNSDLHYSGRSLAMNISSNDSEMKSSDIENTIQEDFKVLHAPSLSNVTDQKDADESSSPGREMSGTNVECSKPDNPRSRGVSGFGFEISLCGNLLQPGMGHISAKEAFEAHQILENEFKVSGPEIIKNGNLIVKYEGRYYPWDKVAHIIVGTTLFGSEYSMDPTNSIPVEHVDAARDVEESRGSLLSTSSNRWRLWPIPFRRVKSLQRSSSECSNDEVFLDSLSSFKSTFEEHAQSSSNNLSPQKNLLRTNIPTSEQIASLNLKDGQNTIAFIFSTRVFGKQQVDAHIYLWKWNARIVISDVDGTITRSDVLGQVMPLVGKDWTQSGVASLFSAIKENGYQVLFLSARAIVQAYLTKSFLFNLKQDGKALPSGPVVISPNGLFPSLYREVIRRAPHEFKIACLQDIRELFPPDYNPFYAGFGNRDTDELTYRKIGIPKGKIFIINPKGEVALYNRTDVKSYTSLHTLVNDMFPPTYIAEQEDYNSWNYWKVPLPSID